MGAADKQKVIQLIIVFVCALLLGKAMHLQLFDTSYSQKAKNTTIENITVHPARGLIYDRKNEILTNNEPVYDLMVHYKRVDPNMDTAYLCKLLDIDKETFINNIDKNWSDIRFSKNVPFVFLKRLGAQAYGRLQESLYEFPGFFVKSRNIRSYPESVGAHVLGYISEVSPAQIKQDPEAYQPGDYIGKTGLEVTYERTLRGKKGLQFVLRDNLGKTVGSFQNGELDSAAVSGEDLITTLSLDLQAYGESLMQNKTGAIVAIEPATGEILSMISMPTYDPNDLSIHRDRGKVFQKLLQDTLNPFFDRSIQAKYPPGSLFKSIVAMIAMQEGVQDMDKGYVCNGGYTYKSARWGCHGHPPVTDVSKAITYSCNTYFYQTFRKIVDKYSFYNPQRGLDTFTQHLYDFGLGKPLGIDFPGESAGNVPTSAYYDRLYPKNKGSWKSPTIISLGIGQGELQLTTMQMANLAAIIANRGYYISPHLVKGFNNEDAEFTAASVKRNKVRIEPKYFEPVVQGMEDVVNFGTARLAQVPGVKVCGKTGTAQNPHGEDHSIFFAFAPRDNPKIAIAVYVENAGYGGTYAAPIASLMIEKYLNDSITAPNRLYLEEKMRNINLIEKP